jgi:hypothetical protein
VERLAGQLSKSIIKRENIEETNPQIARTSTADKTSAHRTYPKPISSQFSRIIITSTQMLIPSASTTFMMIRSLPLSGEPMIRVPKRTQFSL